MCLRNRCLSSATLLTVGIVPNISVMSFSHLCLGIFPGKNQHNSNNLKCLKIANLSRGQSLVLFPLPVTKCHCSGNLYYYRRGVCVCVCAKFDQFLPVRPHFDTKRPVNFFHIATFPSPTFGPLFAFHCPLFFTKNNNLHAAMF